MAEEVIEGEGFIVKDKRAFDTEGKVRGESGQYSFTFRPDLKI